MMMCVRAPATTVLLVVPRIAPVVVAADVVIAVRSVAVAGGGAVGVGKTSASISPS